jgi:hypothetical protein
MTGRQSPNDPQGRYLPYSIAGWGLVVGILIMAAWLVCAGMTSMGAVLLVGMMLTIYLCAARIVAETGLVLVQLNAPLYRPWIYLSRDLPAALAHKTSLRNVFFAGFFTGVFTHDLRENLTVYSTHTLRVTDSAVFHDDNSRQAVSGKPILAAMVLALVVGFFVSGAGLLYTEYSYSTTVDRKHEFPINHWGVEGAVKVRVLDPVVSYNRPDGPNENHNRLGHLAFGAGLTALLSIMRLRFTWWPFQPVGFLLMYSYMIQTIWFSVFLGWLAKLLIVRFGGASLFHNARNLFIGLIIGEVGAAGFWLVVSLILSMLGRPYTSINLLPI